MDQSLLLLVFIVVMGGFMFWNQWRTRKRYRQKMEALQVGDQVVTIGGIYGRLTYLDREAGQARLKIASDVEIQVRLGAISSRIDLDTRE